MKYLMGIGILLMIIGWILSLYYKLDNIYRLAQERFAPICAQLRTRYKLLEELLETLRPHLEQDQALLLDLEDKTDELQHLLSEISLNPLMGMLMENFCEKEHKLSIKVQELLSIMGKRPSVFALNEINTILSKLGAIETPLEQAGNYFNQSINHYIEFSSKAPMKFVAHLFRMDEPSPYIRLEQES